MPLNVRRFSSSVLLVFVFVFVSFSQTVLQSSAVSTPAAPTSGDVMRDRISKAKAFIVVRNYNAAIYELETIRKETSDTSVQDAVNVLLMNSYLEQGDYKRAQDLLKEAFSIQKTTKPNASAAYMSVAAQIVKGARNRADRYRALGLDISDRTLPLEAMNDLEKMRETLELVITHSKEIGAIKEKTAEGMALLEEASVSRSMLARDDYDSRRWKDEVADTREQLVKSRSVVLSAVQGEPSGLPKAELVANNAKPAEKPPAEEKRVETASVTETKAPDTKPAEGPPATTPPVELKPVDTPAATRERQVATNDATPSETAVSNDAPAYVRSTPPPAKEDVKKEEPQPSEPKMIIVGGAKETPDTTPKAAPDGPIDVGSLVAYATSKAQPIYSAMARSMRARGLVTVELIVDEDGNVAEVQNATGHALLQGAAKDAVMKWKFKPFVVDGQPVKAAGFVNFNFSM
ncbi:MAG: TonB family protein [Pyrinomonadaceae bacterium]